MIVTDRMTAIIATLTIICCLIASKRYWRVRNTDALMWVMVTFFWCIGALSRSLKI